MLSKYTTLSLVLALFLVLAYPTISAHTAPHPAEQNIALQSGDKLTVTCQSSLLLTRSSSQKWVVRCKAVPTATPGSPTATSSPKPILTQTVAATPTQITGASAPYKGAPECPTHDPTAWHSLWDSKRGCHYDHEHGDDPSLGDAYFGKAGSLWGGQTISYPFATSSMENTMKHGGYKYFVRTPQYHPWPPCGTHSETDTSPTGNNCIIASRVEYHIVGGTMDSLARYHSFYLELVVCKYPAFTECGIVRTGGHADFANLIAPHYGPRIVRPGGTVDFGDGMLMSFAPDGPDLPALSGEPYVMMIPYTPEELSYHQAYTPTPPNATMDQWSMQELNDCEPTPAGDPCHNKYAGFFAQVGDSWNLLDTQNPNTIHWICKGQPGCQYNGSLTGVNGVGALILQTWQSSGDGFVTLKGYTDRWGNPRFDGVCTAVSVDCIPFVLEKAPVGFASTHTADECVCLVYEHDIYFNGQSSDWIQFPN
jgi:hypothetical protein